jgi:hypothetical protein
MDRLGGSYTDQGFLPQSGFVQPGKSLIQGRFHSVKGNEKRARIHANLISRVIDQLSPLEVESGPK